MIRVRDRDICRFRDQLVDLDLVHKYQRSKHEGFFSIRQKENKLT